MQNRITKKWNDLEREYFQRDILSHLARQAQRQKRPDLDVERIKQTLETINPNVSFDSMIRRWWFAPEDIEKLCFAFKKLEAAA